MKIMNKTKLFAVLAVVIYEILYFCVQGGTKSTIAFIQILSLNQLKDVIIEILLWLIFFCVVWFAAAKLSQKENISITKFIKSNIVLFLVLSIIRIVFDFVAYFADTVLAKMNVTMFSIELVLGVVFILLTYLVINKKLGNKNNFSVKNIVIISAVFVLLIIIYGVISQMLYNDFEGSLNNFDEINLTDLMYMMSDRTTVIKTEITKMIIYIVFQISLIFTVLSNNNQPISDSTDEGIND